MTATTMTDPFNDNLVRIMRDKNVSAQIISERSGIPVRTIQHYFRGDRTPKLGHPHRTAIARALHVRVGRLNNEEARDGGPEDRDK